MPGGIDADERAMRRRGIDEARHSSLLEGQRSSRQSWALQERYVDGELTIDELVEQSIDLAHDLLGTQRNR